MNIVLVHGLLNTGKIFFLMKRILEKRGLECFAPDLKPIDARYGLEDLSKKLKDKINSELGEADKFILIGFSMGGIIARHYLQYLGGASRVDYFFSISTPHHGSKLAYLYPGKGMKQLRSNSSFINKLEENESILKDIKLFSYWTPLDLIIIPSSSSRWEIAENKKFFSLLHLLMVFNKKVVSDIITTLRKYNVL
jgi:triacylglycerol lipase